MAENVFLGNWEFASVFVILKALDIFSHAIQWGRSSRDVTSGHEFEKTNLHVVDPDGLNRCRQFQNDPL